MSIILFSKSHNTHPVVLKESAYITLLYQRKVRIYGQTDHRDISAMLTQLNHANAKIIGFLYTNAPAEDHKHYGRYGTYYGSYGKQ